MFRRALLSLLLMAPALHAAGMDADRQMASSLLAISQSRIKVGGDSVSLTLYPQGARRGSKDAKASSTTHYPERPDFALVSFVQNYQGNKLSDRTVKRQFWSRENGRWKIIHETSL